MNEEHELSQWAISSCEYLGVEPAQQQSYFAIVSWSNAGAAWLASFLNMLPDCFIAANWTFHEKQFCEATPEESEALVAFRKLAKAGMGYQVVGDIHGVCVNEIAEFARVFGDRFRPCALTGHPIVRAYSSKVFWDNAQQSLSLEALAEQRGLTVNDPRLLRAKELLGADGNYFILAYIFNANTVVEESALMPHFKMESLRADYQYFCEFLNYISGGSLSLSEESFTQFCTRKYSVADYIMELPVQLVWEKLPENYRQLFRDLLVDDARAQYVNLGYDLSML